MWSKIKEKFKNKKQSPDKELSSLERESLAGNEDAETAFQNIDLAGDKNLIFEESSDCASTDLNMNTTETLVSPEISDEPEFILTKENLSSDNNTYLYGSSNLLPDIIREPAFTFCETMHSAEAVPETILTSETHANIWSKLKENKFLTAGLSAVIILICTSLVYASANSKTVTIKTADNATAEVKTIGSITTSEALEKANITLNPHESTNTGLDETLSDGDEIVVSSPKNVLVANKKKTVKVKTSLNTDKDVVKQAGIKTSKNQKIKKIDKDGTTVYGVIGKNEKLRYKEKTIKKKTVYKEVKSIKGGKDEKVVKKGSNGKKKVVEIISYNKKGKKIKSTTVYKEVTKKPQNKVVHVAKDSDTTIFNRSNNTVTKINKGSKMTVDVTAYCSCAKCCGKTNGITASGTKATAGRTVAAYSGFPFGTKLYFPYFKNNGNNGIFVVEDRGGAITSGRVDIYFSSHSAALSFGRRTLEMYVVK